MLHQIHVRPSTRLSAPMALRCPPSPFFLSRKSKHILKKTAIEIIDIISYRMATFTTLYDSNHPIFNPSQSRVPSFHLLFFLWGRLSLFRWPFSFVGCTRPGFPLKNLQRWKILRNVQGIILLPFIIEILVIFYP